MTQTKAIIYLEVVGILSWILVEMCVVKGVSAVEHLTYGEKLALDNFKTRMRRKLTHNYMSQDTYLIRWLRARNFNLDLAEQMLLENLRWRKHYQIDSIHDEDWSDLQEHYPYTSGDWDKEGRPIHTINLAKWNVRRLLLSRRGATFSRYMHKQLEEETQAVIREQGLGRDISQSTFLLNLEGFNSVQHACPICLTTYATILSSFESHYPGYANIIIINTPPAFQIILDLLRLTLTPSTRRALKVFGTDKRQWNAYLDKVISKEQRRSEFGGTKVA